MNNQHLYSDFKTISNLPKLPLHSFNMASTAEIKSWIREIRKDKPISDESILVQKDVFNNTRITLLDIACCAPSFSIEKRPENIEKADIEAKRSFINHKH